MERILNESKLREIENRFNMLNEEQQKFVKNFFKEMSDNKVLNEETYWYNTLLDVVGFLDPTGLADLTNAVLYFTQDEYFFCFLSVISVVPYIGDVIAKPLIGLGKGSKLVKGMTEALKLAKSGKVGTASRILQNASKTSPLITKMIRACVKYVDKLKNLILNLPTGKFGVGLKKTLADWLDLFISVGRTRLKNQVRVASAARRIKSMSPAEAAKFLKTFEQSLEKTSRLFTSFKPRDPGFMAKYFWPGATVGILWRNRSLSGLVNRTKWYAGFLSKLGLPFMSPEELPEKMSEEQLNKQFQEYVSSPEGQKNWQDDFGQVPTETTDDGTQSNTQTAQQSTKSSGDPLIDVFDEVFGLI